MNLLASKSYREDIEQVAGTPLPWEKMENKSVFLTGAAGMIGSCLADVIMHKNIYDGLNCRVIAVGRSEGKARERFGDYWGSKWFAYLPQDINLPLNFDGPADYMIHLASNTHPAAYAADPVGTITTNIIGTDNLLRFAAAHGMERFLFASSVEIYGENRGDTEKFDESYLGYLDCNTLRAGYPESKRCGEALCQAYREQYGLDVVIPRLSRVYGPTMLLTDTKASSQFILKAAAGEDVILKSMGDQFYSYTYVADAVSGLLTVLLNGESGEAYNIADEKSDITLRELAQTAADIAGTKVVFEIPDTSEAAGYSRATVARLETKKIKGLSWEAGTDIRSGMEKTITIIKDRLNSFAD